MKVEKCDKKKGELPLAPADPWKGLGTENPATRALWLIKTTPKSLCFKKFQSIPCDRRRPGQPLGHECML
jgi:hypothetical protein